MLRTLPSEELGLWFVLLSFTQFFTLVELGLQSTLVRSAAFLFAGAVEIPALGVAAPTDPAAGPNWATLHSLLQTGRRLYLRLALLAGALTLLGSGGWLAWTRPAEFLRPVPLATFAILLVAGPASLAGLHWNSFLAGLNRVREAQAIQLRALAANYALALAGLLAGMGMIALALGQAVMILVSRLESRRLVRRHFPALETTPPAETIPWQGLWPMAWRTGVGTLFSYLAIPAGLIVCGQVLDLRTTASFGLSLQVALLLHVVASNWLAMKYPLLSQWFAAGRAGEARALFQSRTAMAVLTYVLGAGAAVLLGPFALQLVGSKTELLPPGSFLGLLGIVSLDLVLGLHTSLLIAANRADHLPALAVTGLSSVPLAWWGAGTAGVPGLLAGMAAAYLASHAWRTPWLTWRFLRSAAPAAPAAR